MDIRRYRDVIFDDDYNPRIIEELSNITGGHVIPIVQENSGGLNLGRYNLVRPIPFTIYDPPSSYRGPLEITSLQYISNFDIDLTKLSEDDIDELCKNKYFPLEIIRENPTIKWNYKILSRYHSVFMLVTRGKEFIDWDILSSREDLKESDVGADIVSNYYNWKWDKMSHLDISLIIERFFALKTFQPSPKGYDIPEGWAIIISELISKDRYNTSKNVNPMILLNEHIISAVHWNGISQNDKLSPEVIAHFYTKPWYFPDMREISFMDVLRVINNKETDLPTVREAIDNNSIEHIKCIKKIMKKCYNDLFLKYNVDELLCGYFNDCIEYSILAQNPSLRLDHIKLFPDKPWDFGELLLRFGKDVLFLKKDDPRFKELLENEDNMRIFSDFSLLEHSINNKYRDLARIYFSDKLMEKYFSYELSKISTTIEIIRINVMITDEFIMKHVDSYMCQRFHREIPARIIIKKLCNYCECCYALNASRPGGKYCTCFPSFGELSKNKWLTPDDVDKMRHSQWSSKILSQRFDIETILDRFPHFGHPETLSKRDDLTLDIVNKYPTFPWKTGILTSRFPTEEFVTTCRVFVDWGIASHKDDLTKEFVDANRQHPWIRRVIRKRFGLDLDPKDVVLLIPGVSRVFLEKECIICLEKKPDYVCVPCGHVFHKQCQKDRRCNLCRTVVKNLIKIPHI